MGEPRIVVILTTFGVLGIIGCFAGRRHGWLALGMAVPVLLATIFFTRQSVEFSRAHMTHSETWDDIAPFLFSYAGGFSFSLIATIFGIWMKQRRLQEQHGQAR